MNTTIIQKARQDRCDVNDIAQNSQNINSLSNDELFNIIKNIQGDKKPNGLIMRLRTSYKELLDEIINRTIFLDQCSINQIPTFQERLYCIKNNIFSIPICSRKGCSNPVKWYQNSHKFNKYCSIECANNDEAHLNNMKETCRMKYHSDTPFQSIEIQQRCKQSLMLNHGVSNPMYLDFVKNKIKDRLLASDGVTCSLQTKTAKIKTEQTLNERYGGHYSKTNEYKQRFKDTSTEHYGTEHPMKSKLVYDKYIKTCNNKYGVDNFSQSNEYYKIVQKKYTNEKYPDMTFGSSWEFKVYDFLKEHGIEFEYQLEPIPYEYDGKTYYYIPDFLVNGRIYEVKGDQFFRINESSGKEEMFCPYRYDDWSDEHYNWMCGKYEAKHQCMLKNNVFIIRYEELKNLDEYFYKNMYN